MMNGRGEPERPWARHSAHRRNPDNAEHGEEFNHRRAEVGAGVADRLERGNQRVWLARGCRLAPIDVVDFLEQSLVVAGHCNKSRLTALLAPAARQPFQQPCAERVEFSNAAHVDRDVAHAGEFRRHGGHQLLNRIGVGDRPRALGDNLKAVAFRRAGKGRSGIRAFVGHAVSR